MSCYLARTCKRAMLTALIMLLPAAWTEAQQLGPSVITGAKLNVTKATKDDPFVWGTFVPKEPVQCTPARELKAELITGTVVALDLAKREISLRLPKGTIFSPAPMWGGVVIEGAGRQEQTTDDSLHVTLPVCVAAKGDLKSVKVGQRLKLIRDGSSAPGAIQSFEAVR